MDFKSKGRLAATAGLTAVLALSPIAMPAVTALAEGTDDVEASARIANELTVTVNFYASSDATEPVFTYTNTYQNNWFGGSQPDYRPKLQDALDALYEKHPEYEDVEAWQLNNTYDLSSLWDDPNQLLGDKASFGAGDRVYNVHPYEEQKISYTVVDEDDPSIVYGTVDTVVGANMFEAMEDLADPTKTDYRFDYYSWGDYPDNAFGSTTYASPTQTTILAHFTFLKDVATVTFDYNAPELTNDSREVKVGDVVKKPEDPTRDGYTFEGWYSDAACTAPYDFETPISGHRTIYAKWAQNEAPIDPEDPIDKTHKVTFDDCIEITENAVVEVEDGAAVARPSDPVCEGWTFLGWYSDVALTQVWDFSAPVTDDMTLWAKWAKNGAGDPGVIGGNDSTSAAPDAAGEKHGNDEALPQTGDATVAASGIAGVGAAVAGLGVMVRRRR